MGNFMDTCIERKETTEETHVRQQQQQQQQQQAQVQKDGGFDKEESSFQSSRVRIKLVMTKEELGWLLLQLQNKQGKKTEDVLEEIEKGRFVKNVDMGWKPSLESIIEIPEVMEMDRL